MSERLLEITDHALLRWMERAQGIDIEAWRRMMADSLSASLAAYEGSRPITRPAFVVEGRRVVTFLDAGHQQSMKQRTSAAVPMV